MECARCSQWNDANAPRCTSCGTVLAVACLQVIEGSLPESMYFLKPRSYTVGRSRQNDLVLSEASISKTHALLSFEDGHFYVVDQGSTHGVHVDASRVSRAELNPGAELQLGNVRLRFSLTDPEGLTDDEVKFPWDEHQQLLLSLVQTINSTLVLEEVLDQVLDAVMRITRAERGFLLLGEDGASGVRVGGLQVRMGRHRDGEPVSLQNPGLSTSVVRRAVDRLETVATGNASQDPSLGDAHSVIAMSLRTIVCLPLPSPRGERRVLGALYVDNQASSAPFSSESLSVAEALARHAALAIENAQLFERERRTVAELRRTQNQLLQSEKLALVGQMAAGIAHELNTPLTYILGNIELLVSDDELTAAQKTLLGRVAKGAEKIQTLAQNLLAFSRPSSNDRSRLSVNSVIDRSLDLCHYQILKASVQVEKDFTAALPPVMGTANQLEMAIINLVVNAVHAMRDGGTLFVRSALHAEGVEIAVQDTGPGIPESIRETLFEPFVTTKPAGEGTGLGLSTVLMVVEGHGGRVTYDTATDKGTTFRIILPAAPDVPPVAETPQDDTAF